MLIRTSIALLALSIAAGCSVPKEGDTCDTVGFFCANSNAALECRAGFWTALPCRGPGGCKTVGDKVRCDIVGSLEGDACAVAAGGGLCSADGLALLQCKEGYQTQTKICDGGCTADGAVHCN